MMMPYNKINLGQAPDGVIRGIVQVYQNSEVRVPEELIKEAKRRGLWEDNQ
jgi:hypothetical protein